MTFNPLDNLPIKIGAIVLAFLLWFHVATNQTYEHVFEIPLEIINVPTGLILTSTPPDHFSVQVRATGKQLLEILTGDLNYRFDLADYDAGDHSIELSSANMMDVISGGYQKVDLLAPRQMQLTLEREISRELPVVANLDLVASEGFIVMGEPRVSPERVTVSGPESVMKTLREINTEPQSIVGMTESSEVELALQLPDSLRLRTHDSIVVVSITIEPRDERKFDNISVDPPNRFNRNRFLFIPGTLNLALAIPRSLVDSVNVEDISVSFEQPSSPADSLRVPLLYRLPDRVNVIETSADSVLIIRKS